MSTGGEIIEPIQQQFSPVEGSKTKDIEEPKMEVGITNENEINSAESNCQQVVENKSTSSLSADDQNNDTSSPRENIESGTDSGENTVSEDVGNDNTVNSSVDNEGNPEKQTEENGNPASENDNKEADACQPAEPVKQGLSSICNPQGEGRLKACFCA